MNSNEKLEGNIFKFFKNLDCILIINTNVKDPNFFYFSGLKGLFEYDILIITRKNTVLLASPLEFENALSQKKIKVVKKVKNSLFLRRSVKSKKIGFNGSFLPTALYHQIKRKYKPKRMVDISKTLEKIRAVKTKNEVEKIKKAVEITKKAFEKIPSFFKAGVSEKQLAEVFDRLLLELGSEENAFKTIVAFGKNSASPHHEPGNSKLKKGDLILIDAGAKFEGYCSDLTRMFTFGEIKKNREKIKSMFNCVEETRKSILASLKPGVEFKEITKIFENTLKKKGFKPLHSFGHSIGVEVHEPLPRKLKKGVVLAIEPGVYTENVGGVRIEDDFLITENGPVEL